MICFVFPLNILNTKIIKETNKHGINQNSFPKANDKINLGENVSPLIIFKA